MCVSLTVTVSWCSPHSTLNLTVSLLQMCVSLTASWCSPHSTPALWLLRAGGDTKLGKRNLEETLNWGKRNLDVSPGFSAKILCHSINLNKTRHKTICSTRYCVPHRVAMWSYSENKAILTGPFFFTYLTTLSRTLTLIDLLHLQS